MSNCFVAAILPFSQLPFSNCFYFMRQQIEWKDAQFCISDNICFINLLIHFVTVQQTSLSGYVVIIAGETGLASICHIRFPFLYIFVKWVASLDHIYITVCTLEWDIDIAFQEKCLFYHCCWNNQAHFATVNEKSKL